MISKCRAWVHFILFLSFICNFEVSAVEIERTIYKKVPFSSQFIEDGALIMNVNFPSVKKLIPYINEKYHVKLESRGEAHITVLTPPEAQGWFYANRKGVNSLISSIEIHKKYFTTLQNSQFRVKCLARLTQEDKTVFYLIVESNDLVKVREEIQKEFESRAKFTKQKIFFESENYYPHITIGYEGSDIHGIPKDKKTCIEEIKWI